MQNSGESVMDVTIEGLRLEGSTFQADVGGVRLHGNFISYEVISIFTGIRHFR